MPLMEVSWPTSHTPLTVSSQWRRKLRGIRFFKLQRLTSSYVNNNVRKSFYICSVLDRMPALPRFLAFACMFRTLRAAQHRSKIIWRCRRTAENENALCSRRWRTNRGFSSQHLVVELCEPVALFTVTCRGRDESTTNRSSFNSFSEEFCEQIRSLTSKIFIFAEVDSSHDTWLWKKNLTT